MVVPLFHKVILKKKWGNLESFQKSFFIFYTNHLAPYIFNEHSLICLPLEHHLNQLTIWHVIIVQLCNKISVHLKFTSIVNIRTPGQLYFWVENQLIRINSK